MLRCRQFPVRARDASLLTIEALMADRLRHSLEELLPSPRRGVYILCVRVCDVTERLQAKCKTNKQIIYIVYLKPK